jgi:hypothetical protein
MSSKQKSLAAALALIVLLYVGFRLLRYPAGLFCTAFAGGLGLWMLTTYRRPPDPRKIIVPYLLTVVLFMIHVYEEFRTHIESVMTRLTGLHVTQQDFLTIAAFVAPVIWLTGALMLLKRWQFGYFLTSVFLFGMMFGEPSHFIFPFILDGRFHYVSGMLTAVLPAASGWFTFLIIRKEMKKPGQELQVGS